MKKILGVDVSENNGELNWSAIARDGAEFAIVRASYGRTGRDELFLQNVNGAHAAGLRCGAYHYGYGLDVDAAVVEALNCRAAIEEAGVLLEMPVFYDMEDADGYKRKNGFDIYDGELLTAMCQAFLDTIGLNAGIYASYDWLTRIDWRSLDCPVWNAEWGEVDDIKPYMWQFTDSLDIGGYSLDGDYWYKPGAVE